MKLTAPFMSLDARGTLGKCITASYWRGVNYLRRRVIPNNPNSTDQQVIRKVITRGSQAWKNGVTGITPTEQALWNGFAQGTAMSGFNRYMKAFIASNFNGTTVTMVTPNTYPTPA